MKKRSESKDAPPSLRDRIIGLGERSIRKSYYPQLQQQLEEAEKSRIYLEEKSAALLNMLEDLEEGRKKLAASETRLRAIVETTPDCIMLMAVDGTLLEVNEAWLRIIECESAELVIGQCIYPMIAAEFQEAFRSFNESVVRGHQGTFQFEIIGLKGTRRWLETHAVPLRHPSDGTPIQLAVMRDITERVQAEEELKKYRDHLEELVRERTAELTVAKNAAEQAQQLAEAANQAKSVFLANMSHELRTPLNAILGYAQILQRRPLDPDVILDIAGIEAGKRELHPAPLHFPNFLGHIASIVCARAEAKGLNFGFEAIDTLPTWVEADETRLRQVLLNLLDNAIKFTDEGRVTLRVKPVSAPANEQCADLQTCRLAFEVQDTGIGIAPDQVERIFQPFEQVRDVAHRREGTGLGLAISRQLVRLMGGDIQAQSEPGKGSTFWFEVALPVTEVAGKAAQPPQRVITGYQGSRRVVLVVDDVPSNRAMLVDLLKSVGFETIEAANGQQAIHLAQGLRPDLILMDRWMPVMNGLDAVQHIRQRPGLEGRPIIAVSASVSEEDRRQSREAGYDAFLSKPIHWPDLAALLEECLGLEWEYEEERDQIESSDQDREQAGLVPPPQEELALLLDLALRGNLRAIRERATHIEAMGEQYVSFANRLDELARSFEERQVLALIQRYMEGDR
jgi:PAS domain S-box-containing protein